MTAYIQTFVTPSSAIRNKVDIYMIWMFSTAVYSFSLYNNAPINAFPSEGAGWDYPWELETFENLGSNSLPMSQKSVSKIPCTCLKIYTIFSKISKVLSLFQNVLSNSRRKWF